MVKVGLWVRLDAKPGKEAEVEAFLNSGQAIVEAEPANDAGGQAHLNGKVAAALMAKAPDPLAKPPSIEKIDILATKL